MILVFLVHLAQKINNCVIVVRERHKQRDESRGHEHLFFFPPFSHFLSFSSEVIGQKLMVCQKILKINIEIVFFGNFIFIPVTLMSKLKY